MLEKNLLQKGNTKQKKTDSLKTSIVRKRHRTKMHIVMLLHFVGAWMSQINAREIQTKLSFTSAGQDQKLRATSDAGDALGAALQRWGTLIRVNDHDIWRLTNGSYDRCCPAGKTVTDVSQAAMQIC